MDRGPSSTTQCRYFLHGACSRGNSCHYVHDVQAKPNNVCKFYLSGKCGYGTQCRYDHVKPENNIQPTQNTNHRSTIVLLKKNDKPVVENLDWVDAPVFVPGKKVHKITTVKDEDVIKDVSYSKMATCTTTPQQQLIQPKEENDTQEETYESYEGEPTQLLCPFAAFRDCPYGDKCEYIHGDICDMCGRQTLHPTDQQQRKEHQTECEQRHEHEMNIAFAAQRSDGITCSICLEGVKEKAEPQERYFGLLENCNHPFCLSCIRKWRSSYSLEKTVIRTCPICREQSWFVTPSEFWFEDEKEKHDTIEKYKTYLNTKQCRLFDQGNGVCPFGTSCFYKHAFPDGSLDSRKPELRYLEDGTGNVKVHQTPRLNEFIEQRADTESTQPEDA